MKQADLSLSDIGYISTAIAYPFALKFIWAPLLDRYMPPFMGLRRGWLLIFQVVIIALLILIGFTDPGSSLGLWVAIAFAISLFSASQDIVIDAYRVEILDEKERGLAMPPAILGYRLALIVAASYALYLANDNSWQYVYLVMAAFMLIGLFTTIFCPEPAIHREPAKSFKDAFVLPFRDFLTRPYYLEILAFVLLYKFGEILATSLTTPFMMELGFTLGEIGVVTKGVGFIATILGAAVGGTLMLKISLLRSLWIFGFIQSAATIGYLILAEVGRNTLLMAACIATENFCLGMATAAFTAFLMNLCNSKYTATQYALLTSILALVHTNAPALAGKLAADMGWSRFFLFCIAATIPGLLLLLRYPKWMEAKV